MCSCGLQFKSHVFLYFLLAPVENFSAKVINGSLAHLSWTPVRITGWNISYYYLIYYAFSPSENTPPFSHKLVVPGEANSVSLGPELFLMKPSMVHVFEISAVLAVDHLEGIGEVKGKAAIYNMTFDYGRWVNVSCLKLHLADLIFLLFYRNYTFSSHVWTSGLLYYLGSKYIIVLNAFILA